MKKLLLITSSILLAARISCAQIISTVGSGVNYLDLIYDMEVFNNELYVVGNFSAMNSIPSKGIAKWNGANWDSVLGTSTLDFVGIHCVKAYNGELYVGGAFKLYKFNGFQWTDVSGFTNGAIWRLETYNNLLFVAGIFDTIGNIDANGIASYDGSVWSQVGGLGLNVSGGGYYVTAMVVYDSALYIGGPFHDVNGLPVKDIAKWDGTNWSDPGSVQLGIYGGIVENFGIANNELYLGGNFISTSGIDRIAKWNGSAWIAVGSGVGSLWEWVKSFGTCNNTLFVSGNFKTAGGDSVNGFASWNGNTWSPVGTGLDSLGMPTDTTFWPDTAIFYKHDEINVMKEYQGDLYLAGIFSMINGIQTNCIAKLNACDTWGHTVEIHPSKTITVSPNPFTSSITLSSLPPSPRYFILRDLAGRETYKQTLESNFISWRHRPFSPGLYVYEILDDKEVVARGKIIAQ